MHVKETMRNFEKTFEKSKSEKNISSLLQKRCNREKKLIKAIPNANLRVTKDTAVCVLHWP